MATSTTAMASVTTSQAELGGLPVTAAATATSSFDPYTQNLTFTMADGVTTFTVPLDVIDWLYTSGFQQSQCDGFLMGAATMMLLIVLTMTPRESFSRVSTRINIAMLLLVIAHSASAGSFFTGAFVELYCQFSNDLTRVHVSDYVGQSLACIFSLALLPLVLVALIIQAWSMIRLWPVTAKWVIFVVSFFLVLTTISLHVTQETVLLLDVDNAISIEKVRDLIWVQQATAIAVAVCIPWFCLLFLSRLIIHMWRNRSFLPNAKGLTSVEVLAVTNGIFLVIPVILSTLTFLPSQENWNPQMVIAPSVALILPLGVLIAQQLSVQRLGSTPSKMVGINTLSSSNRDANRKRGLLSFRYGLNAHQGAASRSPTATANAQDPEKVKTTRSEDSSAGSGKGTLSSSDTDDEIYTGGRGAQVVMTTRVEAPAPVVMDPVDIELARIEDRDLQRGVRVQRAFERRDENLGQP